MKFHEKEDIFLEFRVPKRTQAKADDLRFELRRDQNQLNQSVAQSKRRQVHVEVREEENDQRMQLIHAESNFNFLNMHLSTHFRDHIYQFGNILMYSMEFRELVHKEQMKDGWRRSNKIDVARQILNSYGQQHAIRMRLVNIEFLCNAGVQLAAIVLDYLEKTRISQQLPSSRRGLKWC